jgi:class 3 adenylate cyclase
MWRFGAQRTQGSLRCYIVSSREARRTSRQWPTPPTGTLTFLFTDIEGSTKLWERDSSVM